MIHLDTPALIGVVSDTHGMLADRILTHFAGADLIVHAGDIGSPVILALLETVAPVVAVRGNTDEARWAEELPLVATVVVGDQLLEIVHDPDTRADHEVDVVISGHTHRPLIERRDGRLHVNPGSPTRPRGPAAGPTVALLRVSQAGTEAHIVEI